MKGIKNKHFIILFSVLFSIVLLCSCGQKSASELIEGKWVLEDDSSGSWEFFSDGSLTTYYDDDSEEARWSLSENSLKLSDPYGSETVLLNIEELTEERLVLSVDDSEQELIFVKEK